MQGPGCPQCHEAVDLLPPWFMSSSELDRSRCVQGENPVTTELAVELCQSCPREGCARHCPAPSHSQGFPGALARLWRGKKLPPAQPPSVQPALQVTANASVHSCNPRLHNGK